MKNREAFEYARDSLSTLYAIMNLSTVKIGDLSQVLEYLQSQSENLNIPKNNIVHWDNSKMELLTSHVTSLTRSVLLLGREVNRMRIGQHRPMKDFIKEAQRADEFAEIKRKRAEEERLLEERKVDHD